MLCIKCRDFDPLICLDGAKTSMVLKKLTHTKKTETCISHLVGPAALLSVSGVIGLFTLSFDNREHSVFNTPTTHSHTIAKYWLVRWSLCHHFLLYSVSFFLVRSCICWFICLFFFFEFTLFSLWLLLSIFVMLPLVFIASFRRCCWIFPDSIQIFRTRIKCALLVQSTLPHHNHHHDHTVPNLCVAYHVAYCAC